MQQKPDMQKSIKTGLQNLQDNLKKPYLLTQQEPPQKPTIISSAPETPGQGAPPTSVGTEACTSQGKPSKGHHQAASKHDRHHGRTPTSPQSTLRGSLSDVGSSRSHRSQANPTGYGTPPESDGQQHTYGTDHLGSIRPPNPNQATRPKQKPLPPREYPRSLQ